MKPGRWEQINQVYYAALEAPGEERASFLDEACAGDAELRSEVESLLAVRAQADGFLDRPAMEEVARELNLEPPSLVGKQLGPYHILGVIGAGGMGEVYRAKDTRLNRTVAIKVLPRHLSERADLRHRFEREARAIASLDHPHICSLYDIGRDGNIDYLVMQYLEGETLSRRLRRGPLPTEQVLKYAMEISGALDQAHRNGVIHRDLKPGNIMLTESGAKLLDFGLAKQTGATLAPAGVRERAQGPRTTESLTEKGVLLGTLEYMAPEQLEGKQADARTDLFALGVVIYEMATGRRAFEGESKASVIAKILTSQPPLIKTLQPVSPPELDSVVQRCLAKKPEERWQKAAELTSELQSIVETVLPILKAQKGEKVRSVGAIEIKPELKVLPLAAIPEQQKLLSRPIRSRTWKLGFAGIVLSLIMASLVVWRVWQRPDTLRKEISVKPLTSYSAENPLDSTAISPDSKYLAFCSNGKLFIQVIRTGEKRSLLLPEGFYPAAVAWFPDGTKLLVSRAEEGWIQVKDQPFRLLDRSLWSLSILGGAPQKIVDHAEFPAGLSAEGSCVSPDGSLVAFHRFNPDHVTVELWVVGVNGDEPRRIRAPFQHDEGYFGPVWSSNGQRLFYIRDFERARSIESCDLRGEQVTNIFPPKHGQKYVYGWEALHNLCWDPDGRLLFSMQEKGPFNLWEVKVDPVTGWPLGEARRLTQWSGLQTVHADSLSVSADGKQLAVLRANLQGDVYVAEAEAGGKSMKNLRRLTLDETDDQIWDWTADSRAVLFASLRNGRGDWDIFKQDISQTDAETIVATPESESHPNLSPDRAWILYLVSEKPGPDATRLMRVPVGGGPPELVLRGEKIRNFSCAREANLCVVAEDVEAKQVLSMFDPWKGRGERLPVADYPQFGRGILSSQGRLIEKMKSGPEGLLIRVRSLAGGRVEQVIFKSLIAAYGFRGWSVDGKGIYLQESVSSGMVLYGGLDGASQVLWKRGSSPGFWFDYPIPSPDGRYIAFTLGTYESNAWLLENF